MSGINILPNLGARGSTKGPRRRPVPTPPTVSKEDFEVDDVRTMEELQSEALAQTQPRSYFWVTVILVIIVIILVFIIVYLLSQSRQAAFAPGASLMPPFLRQMSMPQMPQMPSSFMQAKPNSNLSKAFEAEQYLAKMKTNPQPNVETPKPHEKPLDTIDENGDEIIDTAIINPVEENSEKKKSLESLLFKQYEDNNSTDE